MMISRSMRKIPKESLGSQTTRYSYSSFFKNLSTPANFNFTETGNIMSNIYLSATPEEFVSPFAEFANKFGFSTVTEALMNLSHVV